MLLSITESARRLGIGKTRVFELLKAEELHAVRLGGRTLIPIAELERFVAQLPPRTRSHSPRAASRDARRLADSADWQRMTAAPPPRRRRRQQQAKARA
jgi:excisionase family DNA binding protein